MEPDSNLEDDDSIGNDEVRVESFRALLPVRRMLSLRLHIDLLKVPNLDLAKAHRVASFDDHEWSLDMQISRDRDKYWAYHDEMRRPVARLATRTSIQDLNRPPPTTEVIHLELRHSVDSDVSQHCLFWGYDKAKLPRQITEPEPGLSLI